MKQTMKQYRQGKLWRRAVFLTILAALETPYNTGTYALFFWLMETGRLDYLFIYVPAYIAGYGLIFVLGKLKVKAVNRYQAQALTEIKLDCVKDAICTGKDTAEVLSFLDNDLKLVMDSYFGNILNIIGKVSLIVFTLCLTLTSNWIFALIYLVLGAIPLKLSGFLSKKVEEKTKKYSRSVQETTGLVKDVIRNKSTLMNYNVIAAAIKRTKEMIFRSESSLADRNDRMADANLILNFVYASINMLPIAVGIYMGIKGYISISAFVAVQYSSGWIVGSLGLLASLSAGIKGTRPLCEKIEGFVQWTPEELKEYEDVEKVEFQHVDFSYTPEKEILRDVSFQAEPGRRVLIQGPSGSGKSTLLKLISGELKPVAGKVLLNGKEMEHRKIGYVTQSPAMFSDTIRYNLTLGRDFPEEKLLDAVGRAGLGEFIAEKGLDYRLEEAGDNISGGQRQRIEIARALLYDCSVLLVDEGTSALDKETAAKVHDTILNVGKTVIEVAHYIPEDVKAQFDVVLNLE
ncbi:MAG: ABC transporter ATP-binding protein [Lachnospiraceae bacterium]|nr:ABC transporter ATP-binding protein [Lachnospiraceae bacterium]